MKHEYMLVGTTLCPADGSRNTFSVTVQSRHVIPVEDILAAMQPMRDEKLYQEDWTDKLSQALPRAQVETAGWHDGVLVRATYGEA
jgi:hypothetical protein